MSVPIFRELFIDPVHDSRAAGIQFGDLVFLPWLTAKPNGKGVSTDRTHGQLETVLTSMDVALAIARIGRPEVARATFFMRDVHERPVLNDVWEHWFPDPSDRPPHKYVPARLPDGCDVALQVIAVVGGKRSVLEIPGVSHVDPMAMGAQVKNLVTSSRLFGTLSDLDEEMELVLNRVRILMQQAGGGLDEIQQATIFVGSQEIATAFRKRWKSYWSQAAHSPRIHVIVTDLGGGIGFPRIEILGLLNIGREGRES